MWMLCRVLEVSRAGFYAWRRRPESDHSREDRRLGVMIKAFHEESRRSYGSPRVHMDLVEQGERIACKRVARLMREGGLRGRIRRRYKCTTMSEQTSPSPLAFWAAVSKPRLRISGGSVIRPSSSPATAASCTLPLYLISIPGSSSAGR